MKIIKQSNKFIAISANKEIMGELTYSSAGEKLWIIDHTQVNDQFRGKKIGYQLLEFVVGQAREKQIKILPLCPFANYEFSSNPEKYKDIVFR